MRNYFIVNILTQFDTYRFSWIPHFCGFFIRNGIVPVVFYQASGILGRLRTLTHSRLKKFLTDSDSCPDPRSVFFVLAKREALKQKIPVQNFPPRARKLVILTCLPFGTVEIDRASLSCIVMQLSKNDSGVFFWFGLVFSCLFAFFAPESG
ncbi:hypothetical protein [Escherichia coli]|uniref:hypothetical protein n=1 Tax=Escherichia coli TaxID=562 RepID=UPI0035147914